MNSERFSFIKMPILIQGEVAGLMKIFNNSKINSEIFSFIKMRILIQVR